MRLLQAMALVLMLAAGVRADPPPRPGPPPAPPGPRPPGGPIRAACFSPDGKWVLTADCKCTVRLWRPDSETPVWTDIAVDDYLKVPTAWGFTCPPALAVAFAADGKRVFCAWDNGVAELDRRTGDVLRTTNYSVPPKGYNHSDVVAFLPGSDEVVYQDKDLYLVRFNFATGKRHPKFDFKLDDNWSTYVVVSSDGKRVLTYGTSSLAEWDLDTGEPTRQFGGLPAQGIQRAGYCDDGKGVWATRAQKGKDGELRFVRDRATGKPVALPDGLAKYDGCVWFSPDGRHCLGMPWRPWQKQDRVEVIDADGKVLRAFSSDGVWYERAPVREGMEPAYHPAPGLGVFSPDGKTVLLTGGDEKAELGLWDVTTGKCIQRFREFRVKPPNK